jgi:AraC family ethanolamine operon transcriptional activator
MTRVTSADVDEHAASLREWNQVYAQLTPGRFLGSLQEICCGGVQVFRETTSQAIHESGGPWRGARAFGVPVETPGAALFRGQPVDGDTMVTLGGDGELDFYTPRGFDILGVVVDEGELESHARNVEHRDIGAAIGSGGTLKPGADRLADLRGLLETVLRSLDENPAALRYRQTQRVLTQSLLSAVVTAVPDQSAPAAPPRESRRHVVDAAKGFMHAHIAEPITVAELCIELGVSRRTLQYSFQEVLGLNPVRFLRALRLNGVRRDLRDASSPADSVQDTAAKWGFWHLGHFVGDYKRMFGELPSETLRRRRGTAIPRFRH